MNSSVSIIILVSLGLLSTTSLCADIKIVEVRQEHNLYHLHINSTVNAEIDDIRRIIIDYENLTLINPYLKESKLLNKSEDERTTMSMLTETCIFFLCYNIRHVQTFHSVKNNILFARIIPERSDFQAGWMRWEIKEIDSNKKYPVTQIIMDIEMVPDFFVPPVIGPYQIKKIMLEMARITINNLEEKANIISPD
jgi:hypothetical protein